MVLAAALISLAVAAVTAAETPPSPDQPPAYTLSGVRRAAAAADGPAADQPEAPAQVPDGPGRPLLSRTPRQQIDVETLVPPPSIVLPRDDRFFTPSLAPAGPAWHQEFLAMTRPVYASTPYDLMGNGERVEAALSSMAFALAFEGVSQLVRTLTRSYREGKVNKVRREIDEETAIVEAIYRAKQAGEAPPADAVKKTRR